MTEYQPNSHKSRELQTTESARERKMEKVVSGTVKKQDNKGRRFADIFISEDAANVKSYIFLDVLVPAIKKAISDIVTDGIDMILYGGTGRSSKRSSSTSNVSYRSYYKERDRYSDHRESDSYESRNRFRYEDIKFESRGDAEAVRRQMLDAVKRYGMVTVADMYDLAGETAPYTSCNYGWMSARIFETVEPKRVRDGYILPLPSASPID